jgi:predicted membrane-bound spermidine synthase
MSGCSSILDTGIYIMWKEIKEWSGIIASLIVAIGINALLLTRLIAVPALIIVIIYLLLTM